MCSDEVSGTPCEVTVQSDIRHQDSGKKLSSSQLGCEEPSSTNVRRELKFLAAGRQEISSKTMLSCSTGRKSPPKKVCWIIQRCKWSCCMTKSFWAYYDSKMDQLHADFNHLSAGKTQFRSTDGTSVASRGHFIRQSRDLRSIQVL